MNDCRPSSPQVDEELSRLYFDANRVPG